LFLFFHMGGCARTLLRNGHCKMPWYPTTQRNGEGTKESLRPRIAESDCLP
jgi:hypothetical protein